MPEPSKEEQVEQTVEKEKILVHITGEVQNPGIVELEEGARMIDAIEAAGGMSEKADDTKINLAYKVEDGQKICVPSKEAKNQIEYIINNSGKEVIQEEKDSKQETSKLKININNASLQELQKLPGIGEATAKKIIEYRNKNGKFKKIDELKNVSGIGNSKYEKIKSYIYV